MASIFGEQPIDIARRQVNPFDLAGPMAAKMKRKLVLREAAKQGLDPNAGEDFYRFTSSRLAQLGDGEGAEIMAQHGLTLRQQELENERANRRLGQFDRGLDVQEDRNEISAFNAETNRGNMELALSKAEREAGFTKQFETIGDKQVLTTRDAEGELVDAKGIGGGGTSVSVDVTNIPEGHQPTKATVNKLQDVAVKTGNQLLRLDRIKQNLNTDFLTLQGKLGDIVRRGKDFVDNASDADKEQIRAASRQRQAAADSLNQMIRDMSGVAVSVQEAKRLKANEPDPGEKNKFWTGDSPTEFVSKLEQKQEMIENVLARYNYILRNMNVFGYTSIEEIEKDLAEGRTGISMEDMEGIYKKRINELMDAGATPEQIRLTMEDEFGVPFDD